MTTEKIANANTDRDPKLKARGIRLRQIRRDMLQLTLKEFAVLCDSGVSTVGQWEQGRFTGLAPRSAECVVRALEKTPITCTTEWLLEGKGSPPHPREKETTQIIKNDETLDKPPIIDHPIQDLEFQKQAVTAAFNAVSKNIILEVQDDALAPYFKVGDCIGGKKVSGPSMEQFIGEICIARTVDGSLLLRKLEGRSPSGKYRLAATNPNTGVEPFILEAELTEIATIGWLWRPEN